MFSSALVCHFVTSCVILCFYAVFVVCCYFFRVVFFIEMSCYVIFDVILCML